MRKWRVGTISMGASLILLGCLLFISQVKGFEVFDTSLAWWPLILVILGIEVLAFVFFSKKEHPYVKYDIFSILFVGVLGFMSIGFVFFSATGIMGEVRHAISAEQQTIELPAVQEKVPAEVERIVLLTHGQHVNIEGTDTRELYLFGTYHALTSPDRERPYLKGADVLSTQTAGDTMYATLKPFPQKSGLFHDHSLNNGNLTIVLPQTVQVEVRGRDSSIELTPGELSNDWSVRNGANVRVNLSRDAHIELSALTHDNVLPGNAEWTSLTPVQQSNDDEAGTNEEGANQEVETSLHEEVYRGTVQVGKGNHRLDILESGGLTVNVLK